MSESITISKSDVWKAIWLAENTNGPQKVKDLLLSLLSGKTIKSSGGLLKFAVVVGHNEKASGAFAKEPLNISEYKLHSLVADGLVERAQSDPNIDIKVFKRKAISSYEGQMLECYKRVNAWEPDYVIELHFNWLNGAGRIEMICYPNSKTGNKMAQIGLDVCSDYISGSTKIVERGRHDRGGLGLALANAPALLTEAFDCSNLKHRDEVDDLGVDGQVRMYYGMIQKISKI